MKKKILEAKRVPYEHARSIGSGSSMRCGGGGPGGTCGGGCACGNGGRRPNKE